MVEAGPVMCLVHVLYVAMARITPFGVSMVNVVLWKIGMVAAMALPACQVTSDCLPTCWDNLSLHADTVSGCLPSVQSQPDPALVAALK